MIYTVPDIKLGCNIILVAVLFAAFKYYGYRYIDKATDASMVNFFHAE